MGAVYQGYEERWRDLAIRAQMGDRESYAVLLKEIASYCRSYLIPRLANPDWADDITQDVLLSIHKSLATYAPDRPFKPWLMAIVGFRKADYLRKHYARHNDRTVTLSNEEMDMCPSFVTNPAYSGELKDIEAQLDKLPKKQRRIFERIRIYGYTAEEVAREMGMSVSAVKVSVHRARKKMNIVAEE